MSDIPQIRVEMADADRALEVAMSEPTPASRLNAVMTLYWDAPEDKRDAVVAVLAARLTLVPSSSTPPAEAAA